MKRKKDVQRGGGGEGGKREQRLQMKRLESFGERGPIFNSGLQATMQGVEGRMGPEGGPGPVWG